MERKNNFQELEDFKVRKHGEAPREVHDKIDKNIVFLKTIGQTIELFTDKFLKTFIKMNG